MSVPVSQLSQPICPKPSSILARLLLAGYQLPELDPKQQQTLGCMLKELPMGVHYGLQAFQRNESPGRLSETWFMRLGEGMKVRAYSSSDGPRNEDHQLMQIVLLHALTNDYRISIDSENGHLKPKHVPNIAQLLRYLFSLE